MSRHGNHRKHINENNNKNSGYNMVSILTNVLSNINPEDVTALIASLKLGSSKVENQNNVYQDGEIIHNQSQSQGQGQGQNNFRNNFTPDISNMLKSFVSYAGNQNLGRMLQMFSAGNINRK